VVRLHYPFALFYFFVCFFVCLVNSGTVVCWNLLKPFELVDHALLEPL